MTPPAQAGGVQGEKSGKGLLVGLVAGGFVLLAAVLTLVLVFVVGGESEAVLEVPSVTGLTEEDARDTLEEAGLEMEVTYDADADAEDGRVTGQRPGAGRKADEGDTATVTVATRGKQDVPDFVGMTQDQALVTLAQVKLDFQLTQQAAGESGQHGIIIHQDPPGGSTIDAGGEVAIIVGVFQGQPAVQQGDGYWATRQVTCPDCGGSGDSWDGRLVPQQYVCPDCGGSGTVMQLTEAGYVERWCGRCDVGGYVTELVEPDRGPCNRCEGRGYLIEEYWVPR